MTTPLLVATLDPVTSPRKLSRLVLVHDPDAGDVPVWWNLERSLKWRCQLHGRSSHPICPHAIAAVPVLARELLGVDARLDFATSGQELGDATEPPARQVES